MPDHYTPASVTEAAQIDAPERIRVGAVARIVGVSPRKVQAMAAAGEIPGAARVGRLWTFQERVVRRWLGERETWPKISTGAARHGGAAYRPADANTAAAYERAIGLRPASASPRGKPR